MTSLQFNLMLIDYSCSYRSGLTLTINVYVALSTDLKTTFRHKADISFCHKLDFCWKYSVILQSLFSFFYHRWVHNGLRGSNGIGI